MKIGTDGVLLGAWVDVSNANTILDIGAGTGVISLMMAQINKQALITAVEIDDKAIIDIESNFSNSLWSDRLELLHGDVNELVLDTYDYIISNPPFFDTGYSIANKARNTARNTDQLNLEQLLNIAKSHLNQAGVIGIVIPYAVYEKTVVTAQALQLYPVRITHVKGNEKAPLKRSLLEFSFKQSVCETNELVIELSRHHYTDAYKALVEDFYLQLK